MILVFHVRANSQPRHNGLDIFTLQGDFIFKRDFSLSLMNMVKMKWAKSTQSLTRKRKTGILLAHDWMIDISTASLVY